jgi:uncharacterized SAM-binding protein YcdF (DUF218 family)
MGFVGKRTEKKPGGLKRELALLAVLTLVLAAAYLCRASLADSVGRLMIRPMTLEKSDVIFVMGGEPELLLPYAVDLWSRGYGKELWCAAPAVSERQKAFYARFKVRRDEQHLEEAALERGPIPRGQWRILPGSISTYTDLTLLKDELARHPARSVLIVSGPYHTLRIGFLLRKLFPRGPEGVEFRHAYPSVEEFGQTKDNPDKAAEAVFHELVTNVVYRARYGL